MTLLGLVELTQTPKRVSLRPRRALLVAPEVMGATEVEPRHPEQFSKDLANAVNCLLADPALRARMAHAARARVEQQFSWTSIARRTLEFYTRVIARHAAVRGNLNHAVEHRP